MPRDPRAWLADIVAACDLLIEFTSGRTFPDYAGDALLRSAVERQCEIVGEALRVALQHQPKLAADITDARAIIAFRNQLTHAYSAVDHATVWGLLERRVPQLVQNGVGSYHQHLAVAGLSLPAGHSPADPGPVRRLHPRARRGLQRRNALLMACIEARGLRKA